MLKLVEWHQQPFWPFRSERVEDGKSILLEDTHALTNMVPDLPTLTETELSLTTTCIHRSTW